MAYTFIDFHPTRTRSPRHVGLIPDGTRRWARMHDVPLVDAYSEAMQKIVRFADFCFQHGCISVSVYLCSLQNLRRPAAEVDALFHAEARLCTEMLPELAVTHNTKVIMAGKKDVLPDYFQTAIGDILENTAAHSATNLYLCIAYSPLDEIAYAVDAAEGVNDFVNRLWVAEPLDLIIRTSGANLLSNFLPLQAGYARIFTLEKLFNDVEIADFADVIRNFEDIARRYGE